MRYIVSRFSKKDFEEYKKELMEDGDPFVLHENNNSKALFHDVFKVETSDAIENDEFISRKDLKFIGDVKKHVQDRIDSKKLIPRTRKLKKLNITFFDPGTRRRGSTTDCVEIDIDSAYWDTAYKLSPPIISERLWRKGNRKPKKIRLMALGVLAKFTTIYEFDGKTLEKTGEEINRKTEYFWNLVCKNVSDVMTTLSAGVDSDYYYFYWVDAIFVSKKAESQVCEMLSAMGYKYKIKNIKKISFSKHEIMVDKRPFSINNGHKIEF